MALSLPVPGSVSGREPESRWVWKNKRPEEAALPWLPVRLDGSGSPASILSRLASRMSSSRKRLT